MPRSLSIAARTAVQAVHSDDGFLLLMTARAVKDEMPPLFIVNNNENIISRSQIYIAWPFEITLPGDDDERVTTASITIDNVSGDILERLRSLDGDVSITLEVVLMSNPDDVVMATSGLSLRRITVTDTRIQGDLVIDNVYGLAYPADEYVPATTPGIFR